MFLFFFVISVNSYICLEKCKNFNTTNVTVHKMTNEDIVPFFSNANNPIKQSMECCVKQNHSVISYPDVVKDGKAFSLILCNISNTLNFMINLCIIDPKTTMDAFEDVHMTVRDIAPPGTHDIIYAQYTTIVPAMHTKNAFKIRYVPFRPIYNQEAIDIKKLFKKYVSNKICFF